MNRRRRIPLQARRAGASAKPVKAQNAKAKRRPAMSDGEWQMRVDLAACYRLIAHYEMDDLFATHISARIPGADEHFLINQLGMLFSQVTASSLVKVDLAGNVIWPRGALINPAGYVIHSAVHGADRKSTRLNSSH